MLIYVLRWRSSWISDRPKKQKFSKGHSNDHSFTVLGSVSSLVSEKKIFEISANQSILLALAAMLNIRLERKICRGPSKEHSCQVWFQLA
jgi:hypothetical protein